jgi:hypothetical protein
LWQSSQLTIDARVLPNGQVEGTQTWVGSDGSLSASGYVLEVVPPSTEVDYWCISVRRTDVPEGGAGPSNVNWYVRDIGDGVTTFDEVSLLTGSADSINCSGVRRTTPELLFPVTEGDFQGNY